MNRGGQTFRGLSAVLTLSAQMKGKSMTDMERWFLVYRGRIYSEEQTYPTRDAALSAVGEFNLTTPGFSCLRIPYRITACEGCGYTLLDCIYDVNASHLTEITWTLCPIHEETRYHNEQTPMIAAEVYGEDY